MNLRGWGRVGGLCLCVLAVVAVAGCGGGNSSEDASASGIPTAPPEIKPPPGIPPKKLVVRDMKKGTGAVAEKGDEVKIQYYGITWTTGALHSNSWTYSSIPTFTLGKHQLLRGLNLAIPDMREGGSREVIIPHNFIYYPGVHHQKLSPLEALIYKVYLVKVFKKTKK